MKANQLINLFTNLKKKGACIYYSDLLRMGFSRGIIEHALCKVNDVTKASCIRTQCTILVFK